MCEEVLIAGVCVWRKGGTLFEERNSSPIYVDPAAYCRVSNCHGEALNKNDSQKVNLAKEAVWHMWAFWPCTNSHLGLCSIFSRFIFKQKRCLQKYFLKKKPFEDVHPLWSCYVSLCLFSAAILPWNVFLCLLLCFFLPESLHNWSQLHRAHIISVITSLHYVANQFGFLMMRLRANKSFLRMGCVY